MSYNRAHRLPTCRGRTLVLCIARFEMRRRCMETALANTPPNVLAVQISRDLGGWANFRTGVLCAPRPVTRRALFVFLHECAHFALHGKRRQPRHVEEHEAERWAHARMRAAGIPVPRLMLENGKRHIRRAIRMALRGGALKVHTEALRWSAPDRKLATHILRGKGQWVPCDFAVLLLAP